MFYSILVAFLGVAYTASQESPMFSNPISSTFSELTPTQNTILRLGDFYYMTSVHVTINDEIGMESSVIIRRSPVLTSFDNDDYSVAFTRYSPDTVLSGGILHEIDGSLYLYFSVFNDLFGISITTFSMKATNATDPMGTWSKPQPLFAFDQDLALMDGTVMKHNDQLYWIGTEHAFAVNWPSFFAYPHSIYIFPMESPTQIVQNGTLLREPREDWECYRMGENQVEGDCRLQSPFVINNKGVSYLVFSAVGKLWDSSLSYISISSDQDPMNISAWTSSPGPVFTSNEEEDMVGVREASFTLSPDGTETWMLFHSSTTETWPNSALPSIEKIVWSNLTGEPIFPSVHGFGYLQPVPSGQVHS